jgi:copper chaperone
MQTDVIKVNGMTCQGCVNSVKNVLEKIPGVQNADVSLEQKQATVQYDSAKASAEDLKNAIEGAGFEVAK